MKKSTFHYMSYIICMIICMMGHISYAQQSTLLPLQRTHWNNLSYSTLQVTHNTTGYTGTQVSNINNIISSDSNTYSRVVLHSYSFGSTETLGISDITFTDNYEYTKNNKIEVKLDFSYNSNTLRSQFDYVLETSLDNVTFDTLRGFSVSNSMISGYANNNYKYVRLKIVLRSPTGALDRELITNIYSIKFCKADNTLNEITCNTKQPLIKPYFDVEISQDRTGWISGFVLPVGSIVGNAASVIDEDLTTNGNMLAGVSLSAGLTTGFSVKKVSGSYPSNTFLGYKISFASVLNLNIADSITIVTYLNGVEQERVKANKTAVGLSLLSGSSPVEIGIVTSMPADEVQLEMFTAVSLGVGGMIIHHPIIGRFCEGAQVACGQTKDLSTLTYPLLTYSEIKSGVNINVASDLGIRGLDSIVDGDANTFATLYSTVGVNVATTKIIAVKKLLTPFDSLNYYGFDIDFPSVANVNILGGTKIVLLNDGVRVDSASGNQLLGVGLPILNGVGRTTAGLFAKHRFDEIRLELEMPVGIGVGSAVRIHGLIIKTFCKSPDHINPTAALINRKNKMQYPNYGIYVNNKYTGFSGGISAGAINNSEFAIDTDTSNITTIIPTLNVAAEATFAVTDATQVYPANTMISFDVSTTQLLDVDALSDMELVLMKDDTIVQTVSGTNLLVGVDAGLLSGFANRFDIATVSDDSFNTALLKLKYNILNLTLGATNIHGVEISSLRATDIACNKSYYLFEGLSPVLINNERTGKMGLINVGQLEDVNHVLDADTTKFAEITNTVNLGGQTSISVLNPIQNYPTGSFAGFTIVDRNSLLELSLFESLKIVTYLDGVKQEEKSGSSLLDLKLLGLPLINQPGKKNVGFVTTKPYNEIQIAVGELIGANLNLANTIRVYGAFVDTRTALMGTMLCYGPAPDFNTAYINVETRGSVATNDRISADTVIYLTPIADSKNPQSANVNFTMEADGSYAFTANLPGRYMFRVPICTDLDNMVNCPTELITFTVMSKEVVNNIPAINPDIFFALGNDNTTNAQTINVLANDGSGKRSGAIQYSSLSIVDSAKHGDVSVDANFNIAYTPVVGFYGTDSFRYVVTDTPSNFIDTGYVKVEVVSSELENLLVVSDDYKVLKAGNVINVPASEGLLANDRNLRGLTCKVISTQDTIAGKGSIEFNADGSYRFYPASGFSGPVSFTYTIADSSNNGNVITATGTLYLQVMQVPDLTISSQNSVSNFVISQQTESKFAFRISELNNQITDNETNPIGVMVYKSSLLFDYTFDPVATTTNAPTPVALDNAKWELVAETSSYMYFRLKPQYNINAGGVMRIGVNVKVKPNATRGVTNITSTIINGSGGEAVNSNNFNTRILNIQL